MKRARHLLFGLMVLAAPLAGPACDDDGDDDGAGLDGGSQAPPADAATVGGDGGTGDGQAPVVVDRAAVLASSGQCILALYQEFEAAAAALVTAIDAWKAAPTDAAARMGAQDAWKGAMALWQQAEVFQVGPAAMSDQPGGQDLRDEIYSWDLTNRCRIEQQLAAGVAPGAAGQLRVNERGLDALEYVLFYAGDDNACSPLAAINAEGTWAALAQSGLAAAKAAYASALAADVAQKATALRAAWDPAGGNFLTAFQVQGASPYDSQQMALNALSDAIFYIEKQVKDMKVKQVVEADMFCASESCVESRYALVTLPNMRNNLIGFEKAFAGCGPDGAGIGFEDLLRAVGAGAVADSLRAAIDGGFAALDGVTAAHWEAAVMTEPAQAQAVFSAMQMITTVLKTDFVTSLNLDLPKTVEVDND